MAKRIKDLEEEIERLKIRLERVNELNAELLEGIDEQFKHSRLKGALERDLKTQKLYLSIAESSWKHAEQMCQNMARDVRTILADNKELAKEHDLDYWIGMTRRYSYDERLVKDLKQEILDLKGELEAKDTQIRYLKTIIENEIYKDAEGYLKKDALALVPARKAGRPASIDDATKKRVRKLYKDGLSYRSIASIESISFASVRNIVKGTAKVKGGKND